MFIPGVDVVGGFSMYSSPGQLQRTGSLDLAVKLSPHPPAAWVHSQVGFETVKPHVYCMPDYNQDKELFVRHTYATIITGFH